MKINYKEADNYNESSNKKYQFFALKNDGDTAIVRFLIKNIDDVYITPVHEEVQVGEFKRKVNCLRTPNGNSDECPFCKAGMKVAVKMYLEMIVYNQDSEGYPTGDWSYQIWERGKKYINKIIALCNRYATKKPLWDMLFEITRIGAQGDQNTSYEILPITDADLYEDCKMPKDLPEEFDPIGSFVMDKSYDDMSYYVDKGEFPSTESRTSKRDDDDDYDDMPKGRRASHNADEEEEQPRRRAVSDEEEQPVRRTRRIG